MSVSRRGFLQLSGKAVLITSIGNNVKFVNNQPNWLPSKDNIALRFLIASDGHYGQPDTSYVEKHDQMVAWLNAEQKKRGAEFSFINGDVIHDDNKFLPEVKQHWDKLQMPYHTSHGNHDKVEESVWQTAFGHGWQYTFEKKGVAFVVLNSADITGKYICPDVDFTKQQLEKYKAFPHVFVFMHITPFSWTKAGLPCPEVVTLFEQHPNIKAIFHGHDHDQDDVKENNGKHYFFDSHIAGNWGTDYSGYRVVEVLKNGDVLTYQMNAANNVTVNKNELKK